MITAKNVRYMIDIPLEHMKAIAANNKIKGIDPIEVTKDDSIPF